MALLQARIQSFQDELSAGVVDLTEVRRLAFNGYPTEHSIRSRCWKLLLNYLPLQTDQWGEFLATQRKHYAEFIDEMVIQPGKKKYDSNRCDVTLEDHPLNPNPTGQWSQYFKDNDMLLQIDRDCRRLYPGLGFFQIATDYPCVALTTKADGVETLRRRVEKSVLKAQDVSRSRWGVTTADKPTKQYKRPRGHSGADEFVVLSEGEEAHWEVVERILFIYSKLNPGQSYVQGMNEIIGPIYYTFASDTDEENKRHAEADTFWCFTNLMGEIRDNFIKALDNDTRTGIGTMMSRVLNALKSRDVTLWCRLQEQQLQPHTASGCSMAGCGGTHTHHPPRPKGTMMSRVLNALKYRDVTLWCRLQEQQLQPQFYAFRWLTLLLSQEFPLPDVLRLWDSLFADADRFDFLILVCCAMLILVREELLTGDFAHNMKLLQNFPGPHLDGTIDIVMVISKARELSNVR